MNKLYGVLFIGLFLLVACGGEEETVTEVLPAATPTTLTALPPAPDQIVISETAPPEETKVDESTEAAPIVAVSPTERQIIIPTFDLATIRPTLAEQLAQAQNEENQPTLTPTATETTETVAALATEGASPTPSEGIVVVDSASLPTATPAEVIILPSPTQLPPPANALPTQPVVAEAAGTSGRLILGEAYFSEIAQAGETDRYTFFGNATETISILVNLDPADESTLNPVVQIQAPSGEIVAENNDMFEGVPDALIRNFEIPTTGVYTVYVKSADELSIGKYILTMNNTPFTIRDVARGEAAHGVANQQILETYGARDQWEVELKTGDIISIAVEVVDPESGFDVMTELVSPEGESLAFDDDSGAGQDAYLDQIAIPADGVYTIYIASRNNASIGGYRLWWQRMNELPTAQPPTATPKPSQTPIPTAPPPSGTLEGLVEENGRFTYQIQADALQDVQIVVQGLDGFDPVLRVIDPYGISIIEVDDVGGSADPRTSFVAEPSGWYIIEISGFKGSAGRFTLNYLVQ